MSLGPVVIGMIVLADMLVFGYKKLPDASRSLGTSLRILRSEVEGSRSAAPDESPGDRARAAEA
jgi:sec-independent protein translocase protein TatA